MFCPMKKNTSLEELSKARERVLQELALMPGFDMSKESHPGGFRLWMSDWLSEEVILLEEIETLMDDKVTQLYEEAKKRAMDRDISFAGLSREAMEGFQDGLRAVYDKNFIVAFERIKSESTYGFAFICGMFTKREAIKGKSYGASWQRKGEPGILKQVQRKTDRTEMAVELSGLGRPPGDDESILETVGDNFVYCGKWATYRNEIDREGFITLVNRIREKG